MADLENNVHHLAAVRIDERNPKIAFDVATDLVFGVMGRYYLHLVGRVLYYKYYSWRVDKIQVGI